MGGMGDMIFRQVTKTLTKRAVGKGMKSAGSLVGKKRGKKAGGRKKGPAEGKKGARP